MPPMEEPRRVLVVFVSWLQVWRAAMLTAMVVTGVVFVAVGSVPGWVAAWPCVTAALLYADLIRGG